MLDSTYREKLHKNIKERWMNMGQVWADELHNPLEWNTC